MVRFHQIHRWKPTASLAYAARLAVGFRRCIKFNNSPSLPSLPFSLWPKHQVSYVALKLCFVYSLVSFLHAFQIHPQHSDMVSPCFATTGCSCVLIFNRMWKEGQKAAMVARLKITHTDRKQRFLEIFILILFQYMQFHFLKRF